MWSQLSSQIRQRRNAMKPVDLVGDDGSRSDDEPFG
jgi:hypothetical protein